MEKVRDFFKQNVLYFTIGLVCAIYLLYGLIEIKESGKSFAEIIADSLIILIFGVSITQIFDIQGILMGERDSKVIATNKLHSDSVEEINDDIDRLDEFCEEVTQNTLKKEQIRYLNKIGIKYNDFVNGTYDLSKLTKENKKVAEKYIRQAREVKITPLISSELTSDDGKPDDPLYLGRTKKQYLKWSALKSSFSEILTAVIFGYYSMQMIGDFKWSYLIWTALQIIIFLIFGVIKMMSSYFFITDELRNRKIRKIDWLSKFKTWVKNKKGEENNVNNINRGREEEKTECTVVSE